MWGQEDQRFIVILGYIVNSRLAGGPHKTLSQHKTRTKTSIAKPLHICKEKSTATNSVATGFDCFKNLAEASLEYRNEGSCFGVKEECRAGRTGNI